MTPHKNAVRDLLLIAGISVVILGVIAVLAANS
jgi:hypothetical protein